jgi:hypothetical protein
MGRAGIKIHVRAKGFKDVINAAGIAAASRLQDAIEIDIADGVRKMTLVAFANAPVDTTALRVSILGSIRREGAAEYIFGSPLPYAQRQEYEHKTKKMYLHRAVWSEQHKIARELRKSIRRATK